MIRTVLCLCFFILSCSGALSQAPPWQWAKDANSPSPEQAWDVSCDKATGDVYVAGSFKGNLSAFYGPGLSAASGAMDGFVAKYSSAGAVLWAFNISGPDAEEVKSVATDPYGNIYVTGGFKNTVDFDPSAATYTLSTFGGAANQSGFLAKYTSAGALLWAVKFGDTQPSEGLRVFADSNYVYLTGNYTSSATFYSTNTATKSTAAGQQQLNTFGAKYNTAGVVQWVVSAGSVKDDIGYNIIADNNNVYMIGTNQHDLTVYDAAGVPMATVQINNPNKTDAYILAYQQSGAFLWASNVASNDDDIGSGLTQDAGNIYVSGSIKNTASFPYPSPVFTKTCQGGMDIFLAKLSKSNGAFQWVSSQTGSGNNNEVGFELDMGLGNSIVMAGYFDNNLNYTAYGGPTLNTSGNEDIFVSSFNSANGNFNWAVKAGANGKDEPYGLSTDTAGGIFIAGEHAKNTVFGSITITSGAGPNIFVAKMGCYPVSNNTATASQTICAGNAPSSLNGSNPVGGNFPYMYIWQQSSNGTSWSNAAGTYTNQNYAPPPLGSTMYYRRIAASSNGCGSSSTSASLQISVTTPPTTANAGADQNICATTATMAANMPTTGSGAWSLLSGSGTVVSNSSPGSPVNGLAPGNNKFIWTISNGVCPASRDTVTILRYTLPTTANAGSNQVLCATSATLNANAPAVGSGNWTVISGTGSVTAVGSPSSTVVNLSMGTNTLVWTISNGVCTASSSTVTITRDAMPTTANAGSNQTICATSSTLSANAPSTGSGLWSVIAGTGTVAATSTPATGIGNLSVGANKFVWTISNGTCPASSSTVTITRDALPTTANAGSSQTICAQSYTLSANTPTVGTAAWSVSSGGGSVSMSGNPSSPVNNLGVGANDFVWTISNGVCPASSSTVTITRDAMPTTANAGSDQALCATGSTLNANSAATGSGLWAVIAGTGTVAATGSPTTAVGNLSPGINKFVWSISNGVCPVSRDTMVITRDAMPTVANAGASQTVCAQSYTLSANTPAVGSASWSVLSGSSTIANSNAPSSAVNNLSPGANTFVWTVSNGVCPSSKDTVVVTRDVMPSQAIAGSDQAVCGPVATFNANAPSAGTGTWTLVSGSGTVTFPASSNSPVTGLGTGTNIFAWTISNGSCPASSDTVRIVSDAIPSTAATGPDQAVCAPNGSLIANTPAVGTGLWTVVSGTGIIANPGLANTAVLGLSAGNNVFAWAIASGICPVSSDTIVIRRDLQPTTAVAGSDQAICSYTTTLDGNTPATGTGSWSLISGSGSFANSSAPQAQVTGLAPGNALFVWTISNGACPSSQDTVVIHVDASPGTANAGSDQAVCGNAAVLSAQPPPAGNGTWSLVTGSGSIANLNAANSAVNGLSVGISVFRWTVSNGVCPSSYDDISVRRDTMPSQAQAGPDQDLKIPAGHLSAIAPAVGSGSWSIVSGAGTFDNPQDPATAFQGLAVGSNIFRWTVSNGACPASKDEVSIYLEPFKIPNAFSPNGDNINDLFVVPGVDYYNGVKFSVFNRWGGVVYENDNYKNDWGGTNKNNELLAEDTYYYVLDVGPQMSYSGYVIIKRNQ